MIRLCLIFAALAAAPQLPGYQVQKTFPGPDARWDLLSVDAARHRLYMARVGGVTAVNLTTGVITPLLIAMPVAHGVVPVGNTGIVAASSETENALLWFDGVSGKIVDTTPVVVEPDGVVYDAATASVVVIGAHGLTIVDAASHRTRRTVALAGEPEFGVVDNHGLLYDNIRDLHEIAVVDLRRGVVVRHIPLTGCAEPTGLAYDGTTGWLISVCGSGIVKIVAAASGSEVASLAVGAGADAVILDAVRRKVFVPSGHSKTLSIIALTAHPAIVQTLPTPLGTRTGAVDSTTGRVYLPTADFRPAKPWPTVVNGTMKFLVVAPSAAQ